MLERELTDREAVAQVQKFVTGLWHHELLNEATVAAQNESRKLVIEGMKSLGFKDGEWAALLVGGLVWGRTESSDADYVVIFKSIQGDSRFGQAIAGGFTFPQGGIEIDIANHHPIFADYFRPPSYMVSVESLVTPDSMVAGSVQLVGELRKIVLLDEQMSDYSLQNGFLNGFIDGDSDDLSDKRHEKLWHLMQEKRREYGFGEDWEEQMWSKIKNMNLQLPALWIWRQALVATNWEVGIIEN